MYYKRLSFSFFLIFVLILLHLNHFVFFLIYNTTYFAIIIIITNTIKFFYIIFGSLVFGNVLMRSIIDHILIGVWYAWVSLPSDVLLLSFFKS